MHSFSALSTLRLCSARSSRQADNSCRLSECRCRPHCNLTHLSQPRTSVSQTFRLRSFQNAFSRGHEGERAEGEAHARRPPAAASRRPAGERRRTLRACVFLRRAHRARDTDTSTRTRPSSGDGRKASVTRRRSKFWWFQGAARDTTHHARARHRLGWAGGAGLHACAHHRSNEFAQL